MELIEGKSLRAISADAGLPPESVLRYRVQIASWPAYAGLLSSVGLGFLISAKYLLPLTVVFLIFALAALGFRAKNLVGKARALLYDIAA